NAAGGNHRDGNGISKTHGGVDIDALQHAVTADVGIDDGANAITFKLLRQIDHVHIGDIGPAIGGDPAILCIQANDDMAGKLLAHVFDERRLVDCLSADDQPLNAGTQIRLDDFRRADATADLDRQVGKFAGNGLDHVAVDRLAGKGAVQVDQVQATRATLDPVRSHCHRVVGKYGVIVHATLAQTHALAVF